MITDRKNGCIDYFEEEEGMFVSWNCVLQIMFIVHYIYK